MRGFIFFILNRFPKRRVSLIKVPALQGNDPIYIITQYTPIVKGKRQNFPLKDGVLSKIILSHIPQKVNIKMVTIWLQFIFAVRRGAAANRRRVAFLGLFRKKSAYAPIGKGKRRFFLYCFPIEKRQKIRLPSPAKQGMANKIICLILIENQYMVYFHKKEFVDNHTLNVI